MEGRATRAVDASGPLTVRELVDDAGLGLVAVTGQVGLEREVKGVHFTEARDPVPWTAGEALLVTTGLAFVDDVETGLWWLDRLQTIHTAAAAIATGHRIDAIPAEMVVRARELKFPLLELPFGNRSGPIFAYVYNALASSDMHQLRRTVAIQTQLLDLLVAESGVDDLVGRVATLIEMPIILFDGIGRVVSSANTEDLAQPAKQLWESWNRSVSTRGPLGEVEIGSARLYLREVVLYGKVQRVIVASSPRAVSSPYADMALSFLQRLVALDLIKRRDDLIAIQRMRQKLLRDFLTSAAGPEELTEWVAEHGVDLHRPWRVALCDPGLSPHERGRRAAEVEDTLVEAVDTFFGDRVIPFLSRPRRATVAILLPDGFPKAGTAREILRNLRDTMAGEHYRIRVTVGCSAVHSDPMDGRQAIQEARDASAAAVRGISAEGLVFFEEMSGRFRLLEGQSEAALAGIARQTIAPLLRHDAKRGTHLVATLRALFDNRWAMQPTAEALFIHRNTLQKRLRRIEALLGADLMNTDDLMELYLGLRAIDLLGEEALVGEGPE
jgi:purine catabolism regulator